VTPTSGIAPGYSTEFLPTPEIEARLFAAEGLARNHFRANAGVPEIQCQTEPSCAIVALLAQLSVQTTDRKIEIIPCIFNELCSFLLGLKIRHYYCVEYPSSFIRKQFNQEILWQKF
jgi:hypothetical protein